MASRYLRSAADQSRRSASARPSLNRVCALGPPSGSRSGGSSAADAAVAIARHTRPSTAPRIAAMVAPGGGSDVAPDGGAARTGAGGGCRRPPVMKLLLDLVDDVVHGLTNLPLRLAEALAELSGRPLAPAFPLQPGIDDGFHPP